MTVLTMRPLVGPDLAKITPAGDFGGAPILQWIRIADLVVDLSYQREILAQGRRNITRIAAAFSWSKFGTVIVSPVEGGLYAIVDGQHRATAAATVGIEQVPCQVVILDSTGQAAAFNAINGTVTRMSRLTIHKAAVIARDPAATEIEHICDITGVRILGSNRQTKKMKPGETLAVAAIGECLAAYGRDTLITALQCVTETADGNPGCLNPVVISGLCLMLARHANWLDLGGALLDQFDDVDFRTLSDQARSSAKAAQQSPAVRFADLVEAEVADALDKARAA